ncbi:MAG TPA: hypothetical protein VKS03_05765 [Thermoanaerobaculia bacterium]|nr:hypothetical protein [Thermoanaerobaculia bacterium]
MKKVTRIALGSAVLAGSLAVAGASTANAQVRVRGSFPLPHGRISISIGDPIFPVGGYVPYGYDVYEDPDYGYGFEYDDRWIPCEPRGSRWIVVERPYYGGWDYRYSDGYGRRDYRYRDYHYRDGDRYRRDDYRRYRRDDRRWSDRDRWDRRYRDHDGRRDRRW